VVPNTPTGLKKKVVPKHTNGLGNVKVMPKNTNGLEKD
jgi:hypothetical protein